MNEFTIQEAISFFVALIFGFIYVAFFWKKLGLVKTVLMIVVCFAVDTDHFILGSIGFREHPTEGQLLIHVFHTIEFLIIILGINLLFGRQLFHKGFSAWLLPIRTEFASKLNYTMTWSARIVMLGVLLHYFQDIPIYAIQWKWGYYSYSIIHYFFL